MLPIAPSTYFLHHARQVDPPQRPARAKRDDDLRIAIQRVWDANWQAYGPRKVWQQLGREDVDVARCTGERLMGAMGLAGAVRGRAWVTTPDAATAGVRPPDLVDRQFTAPRPNQPLGLRLHLRRHVERLRVCRVRDRCLLAAHRRLARVGVAADGLRARCARISGVRTWRGSRQRPGASQRPGYAVSVDAVHRPARRRRNRAVGRQPRRLL